MARRCRGRRIYPTAPGTLWHARGLCRQPSRRRRARNLPAKSVEASRETAAWGNWPRQERCSCPRTLFHAEHGFASETIQNEHVAGFAHLGQSLNFLSVSNDVNQSGRRREIIVP